MARTPPNNRGTIYQRVAAHANLCKFLGVFVKQGPQSLRDVEAKTGIHYETVRPLVKALHQEGVMHIDHWRADARGRMAIAAYALGAGVDAPKRQPKTGAQRSLAYKHRKEERPLETRTEPRVKNPTLENVWMGRAP